MTLPTDLYPETGDTFPHKYSLDFYHVTAFPNSAHYVCQITEYERYAYYKYNIKCRHGQVTILDMYVRKYT
jgi:hypothetical protein